METATNEMMMTASKDSDEQDDDDSVGLACRRSASVDDVKEAA